MALLCCIATAQAQPSANFSASTTSGCSPILVQFTDQSTGNPTEWKWDLGNGTHSNLQHPSVTYFNPGFYSVKLVVKAGNQQDSMIKTSFITVFPSATVNFSSNATLGCNPFTVNFSDQTTAPAGISSWQWDFGDGALSNGQHPTHTYSMQGNYNVTLKVITEDGCISTARKAGYISNKIIKANFNNSSAGSCTPNKIIFQNASTGSGTITSHWDFGDGDTSRQQHPFHIYAAGGMYDVKLVVLSQFGCVDSFVKRIAVANPVSAVFTANRVKSCKPPLTVAFSNLHTAGNTYLWDFGDSTVSASSSPTHVFADTGNYTVKLVVRNSNGCKDSLTKTGFINVLKPYVSLNNLPDSGCVPFSKSFFASNYSSAPISSYLWRFGDGSTSTDSLPVHLYSNTGYYHVSLVATDSSGCRDSVGLVNAIRVTNKPIANFSVSSREGCANNIVHFTDLSTGVVTGWLWSFGDNSFSVEQHPAHMYKDTGWMKVELTASNGGCSDIISFEKYIYIKPAVAKFTYTSTCEQPLKRTFTNISIGADRWLWEFGDSTTSNEYSPVHHFPGAGIYAVKLTVWNDSTGCEYSLTKRVKILDIVPNFFAADTSVCKKTATLFSADTDNPDIIRYIWDFSDGPPQGTGSHSISHVFKNNGIYNVKLITIDSLNCMDTILKPLYITVHGPKASFAVTGNGGCPGRPVSFTDSSIAENGNPLKNWRWDYGDGKKDTLTSPPFVHTFQNQGSYWVSLKVTDSLNCTDSIRFPSQVVIRKPSALMSTYDSVACPGFPVRFACPYAEAGVTYKWHFGDGNTANTQLPTHRYTNEGSYTVKLVIRNRYGCEDSSTVVNMIKVRKTVASFEMSDSFRTCPPLLIQFTNQSANAVSTNWNFGDSTYTNTDGPSHFYTYPGIYKATLIARGPGGCSDTASRSITVKGPKGTLSYSPLSLCRPYSVDFTAITEDAVSYIWDFNDGVTTAGTDTSIRYTYQDSGSFVPKIILEDEIGCRVPVTGRDTLKNIFAKVSFIFADSILCNGGDIAFANTTTSNDNIQDYRWDFGDNTPIAHQENPVHQYTQPGVYYPVLSVTTSAGCNEYYRSTIPVRVAVSPDVQLLNSGDGCAPLVVTLQAVQAAADTSTVSWLWNLGNGSTSQLPNPPAQTFDEPGYYVIGLHVKGSNGCSKIIKDTVQVFSSPTIQISGNNIVCRGQDLTLTASGASTYRWMANNTLNCDSCAVVTAQPLSATRYIVTGTTLQGCSSSDSVDIMVKQPFVMTYTQGVAACSGQSSKLQAGGAHSYEWSPAHGLSNTSIANPVAKPDSSINYRVIGTDEAGCFKDTGFIKFSVYRKPTVDAGEDKMVSAGSPVDLEAVYSPDVTEVRWSPTGEIFRAGTNSITVKPTHNTEYTIEVKNPGGCAALDRVKVNVKFDGSNVFIPNLFSPNNDGVNDVFYPRGKGISKIKSMMIFNRWGELVFEKRNFNSNDPAAGWDGTFRGSSLTPDVFIYLVELIGENGTVLPLKGNVAVVR
jgi:gliding motility-associated-like protein